MKTYFDRSAFEARRSTRERPSGAGSHFSLGVPARSPGWVAGEARAKKEGGINEDGGRSFLPYRGRPPMDCFLAFGLAAAGIPGLVYMHAADAFSASEDDGCTWTRLDAAASGLIRIASGPGTSPTAGA